MNLVENIKAFFKEKGLNWTGEIITHHKQKDFRPASAEDFKHLSTADYLIDFGADGQIAISAEIDEITFKIYGETFDIGYSCYAGDNEKNLKLIRKLEDKDFSKEFVQFQLKTSGLLYAAALRIKCAEEKERIKQEHETRRKRLNRKISMLTNRLATNDENEKKEIREITKLEKLADIEEIEQ